MKPVWLTVDSDDLRHIPSSQGHPTRSKGIPHDGTSPEMLESMEYFRKWLDRTQVSLTIFVIADQLDDPVFADWLRDLLEKSSTGNRWLSRLDSQMLVGISGRFGRIAQGIGRGRCKVTQFR